MSTSWLVGRSMAVVTGCFLAACHNSPAAPSSPRLPGLPARIRVQPDSLALRQDTSRQLTVVVLDSIGDTLKNPSLLFTPLDTSIVHVSPTGIVAATGRQGSTVVLVASDTARVLVPVRIVPVATTLVGVPSGVTMGIGGYYPVRTHLLDKFGRLIPAISGTLTAASAVTIVDTVFLHAGSSTGSGSVVADYHDSLSSLSDTIHVTIDQYGSPTGAVIDSIPSGEEYGVMVGPTFALATTSTSGGPLLRLSFPARTFGGSVPSAGGLGVTFNPTTQRAYVAGTGNGVVQGGVNVVDLASGTLVTTVLAHVIGDPRDVAMSPDGQRVYVAVAYARIYIVNTATDSVVDSIAIPGMANHFSLAPSGHQLYASLDGGAVVEISVDSNKVTRLFPDSGFSIPQPQGTAVSLDGSELYTATESNELFVFNLSTGQQVADVHGLGGFGMAVSRDGTRLYVAGSGNVKIIDRASRTLVDSLVVGGTARHVAVSPDGGAILVANESGWLNVIY